MNHILTYTVSVICPEDVADQIKHRKIEDVLDESTPLTVVSKLVDEELIEENADAVTMLNDRYKSIGI